MRIAVLVKEVPDTYGERQLDVETGLLDRRDAELVVDEIDERALEVALLHKDGHADTEIVVVTMGPQSAKDVLRKGLAMGADRAVHVLDEQLAGADALRTATVLAAAIRQVEADLVVAGNESTDGRGGVVPAMVAELLGAPLLGGLGDVEISGDRVRGTRVGPSESVVLSAPLPAVVTIVEKTAEPRFPNFKGIMTAKRKPLETVGIAELGLAVPVAASVVLDAAARPAHTGGTVIKDTGEASAEIVAFLRERKAI